LAVCINSYEEQKTINEKIILKAKSLQA